MIRSSRRVPVRISLANVSHGRLDVALVDVAAFRLFPARFDPAVKEVASREERDEEKVGFGWIQSSKARKRVVGRGGPCRGRCCRRFLGEEAMQEEFRVVGRPAALRDSLLG